MTRKILQSLGCVNRNLLCEYSIGVASSCIWREAHKRLKATLCLGADGAGHQIGNVETRANAYILSLSSRGSDSSREKAGSEGAACADATETFPCEAGRGRTGVKGGASVMGVSEESLLPVEERDRERGVEALEAMLAGGGAWVCKTIICRARVGQARGYV